mmetsp:Transcript_27800/g.55666  ORF Transcript_27800/g.55666 Transcript_27800/m.55666 type:complete len:222 (+) Transcript_27800:1210-1875(+)
MEKAAETSPRSPSWGVSGILDAPPTEEGGTRVTSTDSRSAKPPIAAVSAITAAAGRERRLTGGGRDGSVGGDCAPFRIPVRPRALSRTFFIRARFETRGDAGSLLVTWTEVTVAVQPGVCGEVGGVHRNGRDGEKPSANEATTDSATARTATALLPPCAAGGDGPHTHGRRRRRRCRRGCACEKDRVLDISTEGSARLFGVFGPIQIGECCFFVSILTSRE